MTQVVKNGRKCIALVRIRGKVGIPRELEDIFRMIHLTRKNHATIFDDRPSYKGMIQKVKDYSIWGEVSLDTVSLLLRRRGRLKGNRKITDQFVREKLGYESIEDLARAIYSFEVDFWKIPEVKPLFPLHPPKGGFRRKIRKPYPDGELGYRGEAINQIIVKMV